MRTETFELIKELERRESNPAARHFADFIRLSPDKDEAADEVRRLMVTTATQAVSLVQDMGLVAHDAFYPEESKRVIGAARRMNSTLTVSGGELYGYSVELNNRLVEVHEAVVEYEENVLELP